VVVAAGIGGALTALDRSLPDVWTATQRIEFAGDTWDGNIVSDASSLYLLSRERITGFWGVLYLRASDDGGRTWRPRVQVSESQDGPDAARHALTLAEDGSLWASWAQRGPKAETQRLLVSRSVDRGRTWEEPRRVSDPAVRVVGVPTLVITGSIRFVAFTDARAGRLIVQRLGPDGAPVGVPSEVGTTNRLLYTDSDLLDAGPSAAVAGARAWLVFHDGSAVHRMSSTDGGSTWETESVDPFVTWAAPRIRADGDRLIAMFASPTSEAFQVTIMESVDRGTTWGAIGAEIGPPAEALSIAMTEGRATSAWSGCDPPLCQTVGVRLSDPSLGRPEPWHADPGGDGRLAGVSIVGEDVALVWVREGSDGEATSRNVTILLGPRP
jgi:hypothetical protein